MHVCVSVCVVPKVGQSVYNKSLWGIAKRSVDTDHNAGWLGGNVNSDDRSELPLATVNR